MTTWILVRHGESTANRARRLSGWHDVALTQKGIEQAKAAGQELLSHPIDRVLSSDLQRAAKTAELAMAVWSAHHDAAPFPVRADPRMRERNLGQFQGKSIDVLRADGRISAILGWDSAPPDGESLQAVITRCIPALLEIDGPGCVAVFAHGGVIRGLTGLLEGIPLERIGVRKIANAQPIFTTLEIGGWRRLAAEHGLISA